MRHAVILLIAFSMEGAALADLPPRIPVADLFRNAPISEPKISPDGKTFAYLQSIGDKQAIYSRPVTGDEPATALAGLNDPEIRLSWIEWANSRRLLISAQSRDPTTIRVRGRSTRLYGIDSDGKNFEWLGRRWRTSVTFEDRILNWTPDDDDTVLIDFRSSYYPYPAVMSMNVNTGDLSVAQGSVDKIRNWYADEAGIVRAGEATSPGGAYALLARDSAQGDWQLAIGRPSENEVRPTFAGFHADPKKIYVYATHDGRRAVYEFDLASGKVGDLVFAHPVVDVDDLQFDVGAKGRVVGARYTVDRPMVHFFDPIAGGDYRILSQIFEKEFGRPVNHKTISESADGNRQLVLVTSEVQPPVYYLFDRTKRTLGRILEERPSLRPEFLAPTRRYTYAARDGLNIPAYVTVPRGVEARNLPAVVLVHGGPWARDSIAWDPEVQLLANRGFVVLQMNFRGSTGLGKKHLEAGYREWGEKIQDDITDGVKWLIAQGIADPDRIGIMGSSFGGYATLVGLERTPELYRAGAAYASVTDIGLMISDDEWYEWEFEWHESMVGGGWGDAARLRRSSPLRHVADIRAPVLLGHGEDDQRVHVRQSRRMASALKAAHKEFEYLEFPNEVHGFLLESNRVKWYEAVSAFFEKNLAPREKPAVEATAPVAVAAAH